MFGNRTITRLAARRQELLIQSEVNRRLLVANCAELREAAGWLELGTTLFQRARPFGLLLAPVLGFLAVRFWRRPGGFAAKLTTALAMFKRLRRLWQVLQGAWAAMQTPKG